MWKGNMTKQPTPATARIQAPEDSALQDNYDRIPYPGSPHPFSHPDHLATLAHLHGLEPPPPDRCRVLELACADGANIIPMAANLPASSFLGVDLSPVQIAQGRGLIERLGLKNITLSDMSLLDLDEGDGPFDYIIAHGLFSWVRPEVQDKILDICRCCLSPNGIGYISYNVYPGWHARRMMREMMLYRSRHEEHPAQRIKSSVELIRFLSAAAGLSKDGPQSLFLREFQKELETIPQWEPYLFHEYLEEENSPLYFHQFMERAERAGLQYLSDADPIPHDVNGLPDAAVETIMNWGGGRIEREQYVDFVRNIAFRRTLLCRQGASLVEDIEPYRLRGLRVSSATIPVDTVKEGDEPGSKRFRVPSTGDTFTTSDPLTIRILLRLGEAWPIASGFEELVKGVADEAVDGTVQDILLSLYSAGVVFLHTLPVACVSVSGERPSASPLARRQCEEGVTVTNQRHCPVNMDDAAARFLLPILDGTKDRAALADCLEHAARDRVLNIRHEGRPIQESPQARAILEKLVHYHLAKMAEHALLVG
jgi:methyltransferase-like protein